MKSSKNLAVRIGLVAAAATLLAASTFAESSPSQETPYRGGLRAGATVDVVEPRTDGRRGDNSATERRERDDRGRDRETFGRDNGHRPSDPERNAYNGDSRRDNDRRRDDHYRGDRNDRNRGNNGGYDRRDDRNRGNHGRNDGYRGNDHRYDSRGRGHHYQGRVTRISPYSGGYRVWIAGAPYPYFVPSRYWDRDRFRIGVILGLGGYYDSRGWYDYDPYYRDDYYYGDRAYGRGDLRGVVETVDYRRNRFVVRNDRTGNYVTVISTDNLRRVHAGDYVEINGDWSQYGTFRAYDVDVLRDRYYR